MRRKRYVSWLDITNPSVFLLVLCESVLFNEGFSTELLFQALWRSLNRSICLAFGPFSQLYAKVLSFLVSSVGRAPVCWAGGRGFKPRPDQHSGSFNNWEESAAVIMTSANSYTFKCSRIRTKYVGPSHSTVTYLVLVGRKRTHTTVRKEQGTL